MTARAGMEGEAPEAHGYETAHTVLPNGSIGSVAASQGANFAATLRDNAQVPAPKSLVHPGQVVFVPGQSPVGQGVTAAIQAAEAKDRTAAGSPDANAAWTNAQNAIAGDLRVGSRNPDGSLNTNASAGLQATTDRLKQWAMSSPSAAAHLQQASDAALQQVAGEQPNKQVQAQTIDPVLQKYAAKQAADQQEQQIKADPARASELAGATAAAATAKNAARDEIAQQVEAARAAISVQDPSHRLAAGQLRVSDIRQYGPQTNDFQDLVTDGARKVFVDDPAARVASAYAAGGPDAYAKAASQLKTEAAQVNEDDAARILQTSQPTVEHIAADMGGILANADATASKDTVSDHDRATSRSAYADMASAVQRAGRSIMGSGGTETSPIGADGKKIGVVDETAARFAAHTPEQPVSGSNWFVNLSDKVWGRTHAGATFATWQDAVHDGSTILGLSYANALRTMPSTTDVSRNAANGDSRVPGGAGSLLKNGALGIANSDPNGKEVHPFDDMGKETLNGTMPARQAQAAAAALAVGDTLDQQRRDTEAAVDRFQEVDGNLSQIRADWMTSMSKEQLDAGTQNFINEKAKADPDYPRKWGEAQADMMDAGNAAYSAALGIGMYGGKLNGIGNIEDNGQVAQTVLAARDRLTGTNDKVRFAIGEGGQGQVDANALQAAAITVSPLTAASTLKVFARTKAGESLETRQNYAMGLNTIGIALFAPRALENGQDLVKAFGTDDRSILKDMSHAQLALQYTIGTIRDSADLGKLAADKGLQSAFAAARPNLSARLAATRGMLATVGSDAIKTYYFGGFVAASAIGSAEAAFDTPHDYAGATLSGVRSLGWGLMTIRAAQQAAEKVAKGAAPDSFAARMGARIPLRTKIPLLPNSIASRLPDALSSRISEPSTSVVGAGLVLASAVAQYGVAGKQEGDRLEQYRDEEARFLQTSGAVPKTDAANALTEINNPSFSAFADGDWWGHGAERVSLALHGDISALWRGQVDGLSAKTANDARQSGLSAFRNGDNRDIGPVIAELAKRYGMTGQQLLAQLAKEDPAKLTQLAQDGNALNDAGVDPLQSAGLLQLPTDKRS